MKETFAKCIPLILASEGSELNLSKSEPGGASKYGVSVDALTDYNRTVGRPPATIDEVSGMTPDLATTVYRILFANRVRFDELPAGVDYRVLDIAINLGVTGGARLLQVALGIWPVTGKFDDGTMVAVQDYTPNALIEMLGAAWLAKKFESTGWAQSGHGWTNRRNRVDSDCIKMAGAE